MEAVRVAVVCVVLAAGILSAAPTPNCTTVPCNNGNISLDSNITDEELTDCELAVYNTTRYSVGTVNKSKPLRVNIDSCPSKLFLNMRCPDLKMEFCFTVDTEPSTPKNEPLDTESPSNDRSQSFVSIPLAVVVVVAMVLVGHAVKNRQNDKNRKAQLLNGSQCVSTGENQE